MQEHVRYVFGHSGKRLRPMLVAYSGWQGPAENCAEDLVMLGSVIELVHLATLVHDDILDEADTRHRQETAAKKYGPAAAVLIGDVLFSHALKLASDFDTNEVCRSVAQATARVCAGEIAQTYQRGEVNYSREFYFPRDSAQDGRAVRSLLPPGGQNRGLRKPLARLRDCSGAMSASRIRFLMTWWICMPMSR